MNYDPGSNTLDSKYEQIILSTPLIERAIDAQRTHLIKHVINPLRGELCKVYDNEQPLKEEEYNKGEYLGVVNRYRDWDV